MNGMDPKAKTQALRQIVHGIYVVGTADAGGKGANAFTATWLTQVSFEPPLVAVAVRRDSISHKMIEASRVFSVNLLSSGQKEVAQHFLRPAHLGGDKLAGVPHRKGKNGCPLLEAAASVLECEVRAVHKDGDHSIVVGEVVEAKVQREGEEPLTLREAGWQYGG